MGLWKKIFRRREKRKLNEELEADPGEWENLNVRREDFDLEDIGQREKYVRCLLEQMEDAEQTLRTLSGEYGSVTSYLTDIEEIEALPQAEKADILSCARSLQTLEESRNQNPVRNSAMSDEQYRYMEHMESEIEEGIGKIKETEDYQGLIKKDLKRLDAERQAYEIRKQDLFEAMAGAKAVSVVCICAMAICMAALLLFQFVLHMDTQIGYILAGFITAGVLTFVFVKFREADTELQKVDRCVHKLVLLQNRVKIRYVNNTNLLDYLYMKYATESGKSLERQLQLFREERSLRADYARVMEDMNYYQKEMLRILRRYQLYDPMIWIHQSNALLDSKEMVEIRHKYISRRQKLRKQMEQNQEMADQSRKEIQNLVKEYPSFAPRILELVDEYEKKYA